MAPTSTTSSVTFITGGREKEGERESERECEGERGIGGREGEEGNSLWFSRHRKFTG